MNLNVRLILGPFDRIHSEKARAWRNDHEIWRWCRQNDIISDAEQEAWYERQWQDPTIRMYTIRLQTGSVEEVVGVCGFTSLSFENRRAEFSLYIDPARQRQGLGRGALSTLLNHGFLNLGLNTIWGEVLEGNQALSMFAKLGFRLEGTRRSFYFKDGKFINAYLIALDRDTWTASMSPSLASSPPSTYASSEPSFSSPESASAAKATGDQEAESPPLELIREAIVESP